MRLKTSIFVSALIRRENAEGAFATVLKKGAEEAGAVFIVHQRARNTADLYAPAPQVFFGETVISDRLFEKTGVDLNDQQLTEMLESQQRFDPDCWIVEIEKADSLESLQLVPAD